MSDLNIIVNLTLSFSIFSLLSFGGANSVLPEIYRELVSFKNWITPNDFNNLFALSQIIPGPNVLFVSLLGFKIIGIKGAILSTLGMCLPSSLLCISITKFSNKISSFKTTKHLC